MFKKLNLNLSNRSSCCSWLSGFSPCFFETVFSRLRASVATGSFLLSNKGVTLVSWLASWIWLLCMWEFGYFCSVPMFIWSWLFACLQGQMIIRAAKVMVRTMRVSMQSALLLLSLYELVFLLALDAWVIFTRPGLGITLCWFARRFLVLDVFSPKLYCCHTACIQE